ncbi:Eukaryotic_translation initiation factor 3 subunit G [Hexamita inflata]|uniref:Eukaryotic_translation initiation factor 3 subunit G n=1 Tax=Hexamita inflata TaxID=28002 RepID=A0ABP1HAI0_9EUKA
MSEALLKVVTKPDQEGFFSYSIYNAIPESTLVRETAVHYQLLKQKVKVPKHLAAEIQERIFKQTEKEMSSLHKEDIFAKNINFMPSEQKSSYLRNTARTCTICGGPHSTGQCPMKNQQRLLYNRPVNIEKQEVTFSVKLEPLPDNWERNNVMDMVGDAFREVREQLSRLASQMADYNVQLKEAKTDKEKEIIEHKKKLLNKDIEEIQMALSGAQPKRVVCLTDRKCATQRYCFIHFENKVSAEYFVKRRETIRVEADNIIMHSILMGERKK